MRTAWAPVVVAGVVIAGALTLGGTGGEGSVASAAVGASTTTTPPSSTTPTSSTVATTTSTTTTLPGVTPPPATTTPPATTAPATTTTSIAVVDPNLDSDGDGVTDAVEDSGPGRFLGDTDFDGVLDSLQPELASFRDPALDAVVDGTDFVTAVTDAGTLSIGAPTQPVSGPLDAIPLTSVLNIRIVGLPTVSGSPAVATLDLYAPVVADSFVVYDEVGGTWTDITALAAFDGIDYRSGPAESIDTRVPTRWRTQLTLEDGGLGDVDGVADGVITVVGAPAIATTPPGPDGDTDGDGILDSIENAGPNNGDSTINNVPDAQEGYVASLPDPTLADPDGDGSNYVTVDAYYLLDPSTYPYGSTIRGSSVRDVSITTPPSGGPAGNMGLVTGLIAYTQTGLPLNGLPGADSQPGDPVPASPATAGTFVWLPYEPNSFWTFDALTSTWTDATSLISDTPDYSIDPYVVGGLVRWGLELLIVDGGFGDADGTVNGEVEVVGAFASVSTDADGVSDVEEDAAPNGGVGNLDGLADSQQDAVTSLEDPYVADPGDTTTKYVTVASTTGGTALADVEVLDQTTVDEAPTEAGSAQSSLISFTVNGLPTDAGPAVALVDVYVSARANSYWKYDETRPVGERWVDATSIATFATEPTTDGRWRITLAIEDGGPFDFDGLQDGSVRDPGQARFRSVDARFVPLFPLFDVGLPLEAQAGRSIPMKWRTVDADGNSVGADSIGAPIVISYPIACPSAEGFPTFEVDGISFDVPIQLSNGDWLFVWQTSKAWSGTCRTFEVTYPETGSHTVDYLFR